MAAAALGKKKRKKKWEKMVSEKDLGWERRSTVE